MRTNINFDLFSLLHLEFLIQKTIFNNNLKRLEFQIYYIHNIQDKILITQWKEEILNGFKVSNDIIASMNRKAHKMYGTDPDIISGGGHSCSSPKSSIEYNRLSSISSNTHKEEFDAPSTSSHHLNTSLCSVNQTIVNNYPYVTEHHQTVTAHFPIELIICISFKQKMLKLSSFLFSYLFVSFNLQGQVYRFSLSLHILQINRPILEPLMCLILCLL